MNWATTRLWSYWAASVLAVLTLSVFYVLQNYGPASTIRELHQVADHVFTYVPPTVRVRPDIIRAQDAAQLARICTVNPNAGTLSSLLESMRSEVYRGAQVDIVRVDYRSSSQAIVVTQYTAGGQGTIGYGVWIVTLDHNSWRVDVDRTIQAWQSLR